MTMQRGQVRHILNSHYGSVIPYLYETPDWDPPVQGRMPRGGFSVIDSNRGPNATKFHPIKLYHSAVGDHRIDHLPFRSWCEECVQGQATGEQHRASEEERGKPTIASDYLLVTRKRSR